MLLPRLLTVIFTLKQFCDHQCLSCMSPNFHLGKGGPPLCFGLGFNMSLKPQRFFQGNFFFPPLPSPLINGTSSYTRSSLTRIYRSLRRASKNSYSGCAQSHAQQAILKSRFKNSFYGYHPFNFKASQILLKKATNSSLRIRVDLSFLYCLLYAGSLVLNFHASMNYLKCEFTCYMYFQVQLLLFYFLSHVI